MTIRINKFDLWEEVFFMRDNKITCGKIKIIDNRSKDNNTSNILYTVDSDNYGMVTVHEGAAFKTKEEVLKSL